MRDVIATRAVEALLFFQAHHDPDVREAFLVSLLTSAYNSGACDATKPKLKVA
jgi:hypothetical protein